MKHRLWMTRDSDGYALWKGDRLPQLDDTFLLNAGPGLFVLEESSEPINGIELAMNECREVELVLKATP